jgi:hypothetical protein
MTGLEPVIHGWADQVRPWRIARARLKTAAQVAKDPDSGFGPPDGFSMPATNGEKLMVEKSCAACDCRLDGDAIQVTLGGHVVEVCCDDCARKLKEAHASATARAEG